MSVLSSSTWLASSVLIEVSRCCSVFTRSTAWRVLVSVVAVRSASCATCVVRAPMLSRTDGSSGAVSAGAWLLVAASSLAALAVLAALSAVVSATELAAETASS